MWVFVSALFILYKQLFVCRGLQGYGKLAKQSDQMNYYYQMLYEIPLYRPFHKTLPISCEFVNWISVRFYETGCIKNNKTFISRVLSKLLRALKVGLTKKLFLRGFNTQAFNHLQSFNVHKVCTLLYKV